MSFLGESGEECVQRLRKKGCHLSHMLRPRSRTSATDQLQLYPSALAIPT